MRIRCILAHGKLSWKALFLINSFHFHHSPSRECLVCLNYYHPTLASLPTLGPFPVLVSPTTCCQRIVPKYCFYQASGFWLFFFFKSVKWSPNSSAYLFKFPVLGASFSLLAPRAPSYLGRVSSICPVSHTVHTNCSCDTGPAEARSSKFTSLVKLPWTTLVHADCSLPSPSCGLFHRI